MILSFGFGLSLKMCHEFENRCCFLGNTCFGRPYQTKKKMISLVSLFVGIFIDLFRIFIHRQRGGEIATSLRLPSRLTVTD